MFERKPQLTYWTVSPVSVSETRLVKNPHAILDGTGRTRLLCGMGEAQLLIDFHEEVVGGLEMTVSCAGDAHIEVYYEETPEAALRREPYVSSWYRQPKDEFDLTAGEHTLISRGRRGFRYAGLFAGGKGDVELISVKAVSGGWPVEKRGSFRCSDERLNRIWEISAATVRACMQDFYEDGVKRDGLLWIGDYRIAFKAGWSAFGDRALARRSLLMIRDSQQECGAIPACCADGGGHQHDSEEGISYMPGIPRNLGGWVILNYLADYIVGIDEYILHTGDLSILDETLASAEKTARFMLTLTDLETPGQWWIDEYEAKKDERGLRYSIHHDCKNMPNMNIGSKGGVLMEMLSALKALVRLAERAQNAELAAWAQEMTDKLDAHIEAHYHEAHFGQYIDQVRQKAPQVSQHVTMRAILAGKKDEKGVERMQRMLLPNMSFALAWRVEALMRAGHAHEALRDIRAAWGKMLDADSLTCWERLDVPEMNATHYYDAPGSYCHGWGASPAWQLPEHLLGVHAVADGFAEICIEPQLGDLSWAEANIPTPKGEIFVRAEKTGEGMKIMIELPECVKKCVAVLGEDRKEVLCGPGAYVLCRHNPH